MALTDFTDEQLQYELDQLTALQNATHLRRLEIIAELDRRRAYEHDGRRSYRVPPQTVPPVAEAQR